MIQTSICMVYFFPPPCPGCNMLQNFLRCQNNKTNYNLVCETLQFLDCICGSTTGGLGLLGLYINEKNVALINQTLESLTEYCQGPCHENQVMCLWGAHPCLPVFATCALLGSALGQLLCCHTGLLTLLAWQKGFGCVLQYFVSVTQATEWVE